MEYAIATFCYGDRYYQQTNRLIESFDYMEEKPQIFVVTDNVESIIKRDFVNVDDITNYNPKYSTYKKNYYEFDFSVKRFSLKYAFDNGYSKVILVDTDVVVSPERYNHQHVLNSFIENSIAGQVTYNFNDEIITNSNLGRRLIHYESKFEVEFDKSKLNFMPEDCIQYISIEGDARYNFFQTWDKCISIKDTDGLYNVPAGNIDEMSFAALYNGIEVTNNSNKSINLLIAHHDKWY
jgi:hypothetical protein